MGEDLYKITYENARVRDETIRWLVDNVMDENGKIVITADLKEEMAGDTSISESIRADILALEEEVEYEVF